MRVGLIDRSSAMFVTMISKPNSFDDPMIIPAIVQLGETRDDAIVGVGTGLIFIAIFWVFNTMTYRTSGLQDQSVAGLRD